MKNRIEIFLFTIFFILEIQGVVKVGVLYRDKISFPQEKKIDTNPLDGSKWVNFSVSLCFICKMGIILLNFVMKIK